MERKLERKEIKTLLGWTLSYYKPFALLTVLYILCGGLIILGELMIPRRVADFGTHDELMESSFTYRKLYENQRLQVIQ